jgi:hypothetical protein
MANIAAYNAISSGDDVLASVVSDNFDKISAAINSNALDSDNYGLSSILSQHISTGAILSQHFSNSAIVSQKIATSAVVNTHMNYASASGGVRAVQVPSAPPALGVIAARVSQTMTLTASASATTAAIQFSDCPDGSPAFTATPQVGIPAIIATGSDVQTPHIQLTGLDSDGAQFLFVWSATTNVNLAYTLHVGAMGPL